MNISATAGSKEKFVRALARNKIGKQVNTRWLSRVALVHPDKLTALSTVQFIQRLAYTDVGKVLRNKAARTLKRIRLWFVATNDRYGRTLRSGAQ